MIRVLIVDDDKLARKGLISIMPWKSYDMEIVGDVSNGIKALEFLRDNAVDLMFVDLAMPVMSGIELMQKTRKDYPDVNFVVLTFHENFEYVQTALRLGALDYISKAELESENYDHIFGRILEKIEGKNRGVLTDEQCLPVNKYNQKPETVINEDIWDEIKEEWYKLYWLYDDDMFENLCSKLEENKVPVHLVEQLFIKLIVMIELATGIKNENALNIENTNAAVKWIEKYRKYLYHEAVQSGDLSKLPICIFKAKAFVRENINKQIRQEEVASCINMSRSYFSQSFKRIVGSNFIDYVKKEKVKLAKKLLLESNETLTNIAQAVGYEDVKYFSHVFYEQVHINPSEFRQQSSTYGEDC